jgi:predicted transcriptional regulator
MKTKPTLFDHIDEIAEKRADARAEADIREGRLVSHAAVRAWLDSWGSAKPLPVPLSR